jgi:hypothetical protein
MSPTRVLARSAFVGLEVDARVRWRLHGSPSFDPALPTGPFTTLVAFLPQAFAAQLVETIGALPALNDHYRYTPEQLHVTIRNLDGVDLGRLPALLAGQQPIRLKVDGLGFTRETLLLRLLATDSNLRGLRTQLDDLPGMQRGPRLLRDLVFANVLRLNAPVSPELFRSVKHQRNDLLTQQAELPELTLVRTDKVGSPDRTEVLGRYKLPAH